MAHHHIGRKRVIWIAQRNGRTRLWHHQGSTRLPPLSSSRPRQSRSRMDPGVARLQHQAPLPHPPIQATCGGLRSRSVLTIILWHQAAREKHYPDRIEKRTISHRKSLQNPPKKMPDTMSSKSKVKQSFGFAEMIDSEPTTCGGILPAEACRSTRHQENQKFDRLLGKRLPTSNGESTSTTRSKTASVCISGTRSLPTSGASDSSSANTGFTSATSGHDRPGFAMPFTIGTRMEPGRLSPSWTCGGHRNGSIKHFSTDRNVEPRQPMDVNSMTQTPFLLLHGIVKKSRTTPKQELDLARKRQSLYAAAHEVLLKIAWRQRWLERLAPDRLGGVSPVVFLE
jgi:hypothetical protein